MTSLPFRTWWLTGLSIAAVLAVNLAGLGGIAMARRAARDEAGRAFADETAARGRAIEGLLSAIRADLAFLAASSPVGRLDQAVELTIGHAEHSSVRASACVGSTVLRAA